MLKVSLLIMVLVFLIYIIYEIKNTGDIDDENMAL